MLAYPKGQSDNRAEGRLTFIDNGVDMTTGMFKLKATYQNKDRRLWPGQFVRCCFRTFYAKECRCRSDESDSNRTAG